MGEECLRVNAKREMGREGENEWAEVGEEKRGKELEAGGGGKD